MKIRPVLAAASLLALVVAATVQAATPFTRGLVAKAMDDVATTLVGGAVSIDVLANDGNLGRVRVLFVLEPPRNGTARIVDGKVLYTPAAGFSGRDAFRYYAKGALGTGVATVSVDVNAGEVVTLRGRVVDAPVANATVQASVNGLTFSTQADFNGSYVLDIASTGGGMVMLGARGTGAQSFVNFMGVLGDFGRVQAEAGGDAELTRDENNQVQLSGLSTAQAYLLQVANGGAPIGSDAQLTAARERLDHSQLLQQAAAIKLVVDHDYALPAGIVDTLDLISDSEALAAFIETVYASDWTALSDAITAIVHDPEVIVPATVADFVGTYSLVFDLGKPGAISGGYIQGARVTLAADGTGTFVGTQPNADPSLSWSLINGRAVLNMHSPAIWTTYVLRPDGIHQTPELSSDVLVELSPLFEGDARDTFAVATTTQVTYPDAPEMPGFSRTAIIANLAIRDAGGIIPYAAPEVIGTRTLRIEGPPNEWSKGPSGSAMFTFSAGGTGLRAGNRPFAWTIDALGRLSVSYPNGDAALYSRIVEDGRAAEGVVGELLVGGLRSSSTALSARSDGFVFNEDNARQAWLSGFSISRTAAGLSNFFIVLDPAQIAWQVSVTQNTSWAKIGWRVDGGVVDATSYVLGTQERTHYCEVGVDGCYILQVRRWRPVAIDGNRVYVIEEIFANFFFDGTLTLIQQRTNYYDASPRPPLPVAMPAQPPKAQVSKTAAKPKVR